MNNSYENEIPKYLKSKESNISKSKKKSKHKHQYEECLIQYRWNLKSNAFTQEDKEKIHTRLSSYCTICGKRGSYLKNGKCHIEVEHLEQERKNGKAYWIRISEEEIYERYHDKLPVFFIDDVSSDYVPLKTK